MFTKFLFTIFVPLNPPPCQTAKRWISSCFSIKRTSNGIANTQPRLRTNPPKIANKQNCEQTGVSDLRTPRTFLIEGGSMSVIYCPLYPKLLPIYSKTICGEICDQGRHLQECSGAQTAKVPPGVLFQCFWAPGSECPKECFGVLFGVFGAKKTSKSTQKALFGALGARCPKTAKKHSGGHFPVRAPEHSCKWRP